MKYELKYKSSTISENATLGTIESDATGLNGKFDSEPFRGFKILEKLLEYDFKTVLDVGAGGFQHSQKLIDNDRIVDAVDFGESVYYEKGNTKGIRNLYLGDFNKLKFDYTYEAIWCSHILEHQLNVNQFLKKINDLLDEGGVLGIVVPPRKPFIVGGHLSLWNAGLLLYNLVMAGFDCSKNCHILQYDYNIGIVIKKKSIESFPDNLTMDKGDLKKLQSFFPFNVEHGFNGDILEFNWK